MEERIQDKIKHQTDMWVEYGVPLDTLPYIRILKIEDDLSDQEGVSRTASEEVEKEAKRGRFGAFVTRRFDPKGEVDIVESWSSDPK